MIMKLKAPTEHAVKILIYIRDNSNEAHSAKEISKNIGLTNSYFMRIVKDLKKAGIITSTQGRYGGFCLSRPASDISLYDVVHVMEGDSVKLYDRTEEQLLQDEQVDQILEDLSGIIEKYLRHIKLSSM